MPKAPRSVAKRRRHKKWIKRAKGYQGRRSHVFKLAKEAVVTAGQHAFHDRRKKKGQFRALWQIRLNAAVRPHGLSYSRFIHALKLANSELDRKALAALATSDSASFSDLVTKITADAPAESKQAR